MIWVIIIFRRRCSVLTITRTTKRRRVAVSHAIADLSTGGDEFVLPTQEPFHTDVPHATRNEYCG